MALQARARRNVPATRRPQHGPVRRPLFTLGRTPPRAPTRAIRLRPETHQKHNCTITFLRDPQQRVHSVIVDIPRRKPVRVTPQEYEQWRKIALQAKKKNRGHQSNFTSMAAGVVATNPGVFAKLIGHGKTIGGDALQALIDIAMNA